MLLGTGNTRWHLNKLVFGGGMVAGIGTGSCEEIGSRLGGGV